MTEFPKDMHDQLKHYVYRLIDPRDGSTFYVGRGHANRVFDHVKASLESDDNENLRLDKIRRIKGLGLNPRHVIHRHGMSSREAILAEAVLIDAYPGLTNIVAGEGSNDYGPANAEELISRYAAPEIQFEKGRKFMIIKIKWETVEACEPREGTPEHDPIYQAVRGRWRVSKPKANQADFVLAVIDGICRGVYIPDGWRVSEFDSRRLEFDGRKADGVTWGRYVGNRIPARMRRKGMANPVLYEG